MFLLALEFPSALEPYPGALVNSDRLCFFMVNLKKMLVVRRRGRDRASGESFHPMSSLGEGSKLFRRKDVRRATKSELLRFPPAMLA